MTERGMKQMPHDEPSGCPAGPPGRAQPLARDAQRGLPRARPRLALRGARRRAGAVRRRCSSPFPGRGSWARTSRFPTSCGPSRLPTRPTDVARAVGAANTLVLPGRARIGRQHRRRGIPAALRERAPGRRRACALWCWARAAPEGGRLCAPERRGGERGGLEPPSRKGRDTRVRPRAGFRRNRSAERRGALENLLRPACKCHIPGHARRACKPDPWEVAEFFKAVPLSADELDDRLTVVDLVYRQDRTPLLRPHRPRAPLR